MVKIGDFTYKSCSGTILEANDYDWKSSIAAQCRKIVREGQNP
jgi:hypothetical protein